jgi:hypothetical protein
MCIREHQLAINNLPYLFIDDFQNFPFGRFQLFSISIIKKNYQIFYFSPRWKLMLYRCFKKFVLSTKSYFFCSIGSLRNLLLASTSTKPVNPSKNFKIPLFLVSTNSKMFCLMLMSFFNFVNTTSFQFKMLFFGT